MALTGALALRIGYMTTFFGSTARAPTNPPRELPHIFLTALARFARWTGVYACCLDALVRSGVMTIMTSIWPPLISISRCA